MKSKDAYKDTNTGCSSLHPTEDGDEELKSDGEKICGIFSLFPNLYRPESTSMVHPVDAGALVICFLPLV